MARYCVNKDEQSVTYHNNTMHTPLNNSAVRNRIPNGQNDAQEGIINPPYPSGYFMYTQH